jgi:hypothetical protein
MENKTIFIIGFILINILDCISSVYLINIGFIELNPIFNSIFEYSIYLPLIFKILFTIVSIYILNHYLNIVKYGYTIGGIILFLMVINNIKYIFYEVLINVI